MSEYGVIDAEVVGDLIDALSDEVSLLISDDPHLKERVRAVVAELGGPWATYLDAWWLREETNRGE